MENDLPCIKYAPAHIYFDILNSYAVELGETGGEEAPNISHIVLVAPFARLPGISHIENTRQHRDNVLAYLNPFEFDLTALYI